MRSTTTLALTLTLFAGILSAGEPVPLPIEEDSVSLTASTELLYEQITCCPEAVAECTTTDCEYSTCDTCDSCDECEYIELRDRTLSTKNRCLQVPGAILQSNDAAPPLSPGFDGRLLLSSLQLSTNCDRTSLGTTFGRNHRNSLRCNIF